MFIAYAAMVIDPSAAAHFQSEDSREVQKVLPVLVMHKTPIWCQILFFGAVLSAILSTASGTLLAPSSILVENVLQPLTKHFDDKRMLRLLRVDSGRRGGFVDNDLRQLERDDVRDGRSRLQRDAGGRLRPAGLRDLLVACQDPGSTLFDPASSLSAGSEPSTRSFDDESSEVIWQCIPPQLYGLAASFLGMIVGSLMPNWIEHRQGDPAALANRRSAPTGH